MSNILLVPFMRATKVDIKAAVDQYIQTSQVDEHPDAYKWDTKHWATLRSDATSENVHVSKTDILTRYHAQLVFALTKLPANIGLNFDYILPFSSSGSSHSMSNLYFERAATLFNLAALYSHLAASEERSSSEGLKRALSLSQNAAGVFSYLRTSVHPKFEVSLEYGQTTPVTLGDHSMRSLEAAMLAQAQECVWQRAVLDNMKNGVIAKLAIKTSALYGDAVQALRDSDSTKRGFPASWAAHLEAKQLHFEAAAHFRKSVDELDGRRYGHELARLFHAKTCATRAYDVARKGGASSSVVQDAKGLVDALTQNITRAERDNDLIYHQDVPSISSLEIIAPAAMAKSTTPAGLLEPQSVLEKANESVIFGELLPWGAKEAINIYNERRKDWLEEHVFNRAQQLDTQVSRTLEELHLPAALDALEKPVGLPPSLLRKAEEVRLGNGPRQIEAMLADIQALASNVASTLEDSLDIIDAEVEDEDTWHQPLIAKYDRYRGVLKQAAESDALTASSWEEWEEKIEVLAHDEAAIDAYIPATTMSAASANRETKLQSRALRRLVESVDDIQRERTDIARRARQLADADDITPQVSRHAAGLARWTEVNPAMFEDMMEAELLKFDKFAKDVERDAGRQEEMLRDMRTRNTVFLQSRADDPRVHARQVALQDLDLAYNKYKEISTHLVEGHQFYNGLADIFAKFKQECHDWVAHKRSAGISAPEIPQAPVTHAITQSTPELVSTPLASSPVAHRRPEPAIKEEHVPSLPTAPRTVPASPPPMSPSQAARGIAAALPPPGSGDWEEVSFGFSSPATPVVKTKKKKKKSKVAM